MVPLLRFVLSIQRKRYGGYNRIIARRDLCALLAAQIPKEKIKFGKRVLEVRQNAGEVIIRCSDKSVHHADILVGCDGAYSAVRQGLYADLSAKGELPKQDNAPMGYQYDCLGNQPYFLELLGPVIILFLLIFSMTNGYFLLCPLY